MKFTLTITDASTADITRLMAAINGENGSNYPHGHPAPVQLGAPQQPAPSTDDDDESGDSAPVAPGSVDADGLPHDARIHSEPAKLTSKGVWRKRRGVSPTMIATVEAELRSRGTAPQPQQQPAPMFDHGTPAATQQMPSAPVPMPTMPATAMPQQMPSAPVPMPSMPMPQQMPAAAPQPQPAPAPQPAPSGQVDFHTFMQTLSAGMQRRDEQGMPLVNADYLAKITAEISQAFGQQLNAITDIASNPQMIGYAVQLLQRDGRWQ